MEKEIYTSHIALKNIKINDKFWSAMQEKVRAKVIPYQFEAINDRIPQAEKSYCVENFKKAKIAVAARKMEKHYQYTQLTNGTITMTTPRMVLFTDGCSRTQTLTNG